MKRQTRKTPVLQFRRARAPRHPFFAAGDRLLWIEASGRYRIIFTKRLAGVEIPKPSRKYLALVNDNLGPATKDLDCWCVLCRLRTLSGAIKRCQAHARREGGGA